MHAVTAPLEQSAVPVGEKAVWFGGVLFRFGALGDGLSSLPHEAVTGDRPLPGAAAAEVFCHLKGARASPLPRAQVRWCWEGDRASTYETPFRATLQRRSPGSYEAFCPATHHATDLLTYLLWPVLLREGGLVLHACVAECAQGAVAFVGPSGAGKSTAAALTRGASLFARDVAAVFRAEGRVWVAPMPGGSQPPEGSVLSTASCLPLRGILRVRQATGTPSIVSRDGAEALATVLAALRHGSVTPEDHGRQLDAALATSMTVRVGTAHTVLGCDLAPSLRTWLGA